MYLELFNKITDIIEELQAVQRDTEEQYIHGDNSELILMESIPGDNHKRMNIHRPDEKERMSKTTFAAKGPVD